MYLLLVAKSQNLIYDLSISPSIALIYQVLYELMSVAFALSFHYLFTAVFVVRNNYLSCLNSSFQQASIVISKDPIHFPVLLQFFSVNENASSMGAEIIFTVQVRALNPSFLSHGVWLGTWRSRDSSCYFYLDLFHGNL